MHYLVCSCKSSEHTLRFMYDKDNDEMYTEVYLSDYPTFLNRVLAAIKYIMGHKSKYGHFDCTIISKSEARKLAYFIKNYTK